MRSFASEIAVLIIGILWATALFADSNLVDFNRDIRPILSDACYHCHGPDKARRKADLRFDQEDAAKRVIVAGNLEKSKIIQRIASNDPEHRMPPANSGRKLTSAQIELLQRWVEQGAKWQKHWAFVAPVRPEPPAVKNQAWVRNPIDRFILSRLEKEGLTPSSRAELASLIRRVSLDLTGLPPTPEQVEEFVRESAKDPQAAYVKVVDRLLASPRYGERMSWRWLEAARYADTHGYQTDGPRDMYRWRDWVIQAYNRNLPFDQFTIEQLAGDMLPNATLDQKIATGFNRNHRGNSEGGIVPEEYAVEYVVDRVETTSTVWLGLTLGCTRCHDHKYDPFSQREFYQLFAYFNSIPEKGRAVKLGNSPPYIKAPTNEQDRLLLDLDAQLLVAEQKLQNLGPRIDEALIAWGRNLLVVRDWHPERGLLAFPRLNTKIADEFRQDADNVLDLDGKTVHNAGDLAKFGFDDKFSFSFWIEPKKLNGVILSRMVEEQRANGYSIHLVDGKIQAHFTQRWLDDALRVESTQALDANRWQHVTVTYDGFRHAAGVKIYIDGVLSGSKVLLDELNQTFKTEEPLRIGGGGAGPPFAGRIRDVLIYGRELDADEAAALSVREEIAVINGPLREKRTANQQLKLRLCFLEREAPVELRAAYAQVVRLRDERRQLFESLPTVMVMEELPTPRDAYLLIRGEYDKRGEKVGRAVPSHLPPMPRHLPSNRLGLAKWLVDSKNPLTARVAVNRMWQLHFGTGLVKTVEDFGTQGEYPSHPELLDWLATEFMRIGWDVKKMHKLIVTSATYQQSSRITKEQQARDPENRLLARGPRYRLSAEMVRDQALSASGLLIEKLGGPSVKPYQPPGLWKELSGTDDYQQDHGENLYRRSLYTFWKRTSAPPTLATFDASGRETCWVRETRTNTPLQALTLLNDVTYVEAARLMAERIIKEQKSPDDRIERAFMLVVSRTPTKAELLILRQALDQHLADYRKNPDAAKKLLRIGEKPADAKIDAGELAAYAQVCSLILNLDEAVTKE
jgi:Protein of unknown function (DUF1553)/Protein of unknown function (DUF1549)/Concanavalin A-like lectin/glucanases superfamily/Planctomycete cytochrome C